MDLNSVRQGQGSGPTKPEDRPLVPPGTPGASSGPHRTVDDGVSGEAEGCEVYTNATFPVIVAPIPMRLHVVSPLLKAYEVDEGSSPAFSEAGGVSFDGESCAEQQQNVPSPSNNGVDGSLESAEAQSIAEMNAMVSAPWSAIHSFESGELTCVEYSIRQEMSDNVLVPVRHERSSVATMSFQFHGIPHTAGPVAAAARDRDGDVAMANGSPMTAEDQAPGAVQETPYNPFPGRYHKCTSVTTSSQLLYVPQTGESVPVDVVPRMDVDGDVVMDEASTNYPVD
ncbi:hypothetical protein VM1G_00589 [Cytospora mali]|uniref:Uncharacterized protein n=1 Tax=Cytospora mali TaxID=578113 RepID=A0A194VK81_CYTMA|nr:hypothetical protein VM1G_00589 [Valsa mali]